MRESDKKIAERISLTLSFKRFFSSFLIKILGRSVFMYFSGISGKIIFQISLARAWVKRAKRNLIFFPNQLENHVFYSPLLSFSIFLRSLPQCYCFENQSKCFLSSSLGSGHSSVTLLLCFERLSFLINECFLLSHISKRIKNVYVVTATYDLPRLLTFISTLR